MPDHADVTVAAYYYPCTHPHPAWDRAKYPGFTEWDLIRRAKPRFPGHRQPRVPVWGYEDESDPAVMAKKIDAAADHGVGVFLFDWYHYDTGPYLERALDRGFLGAKNNGRIRFALMWANHDWYDIQGYNPAEPITLLYPGRITEATWEIITDLIVERYFTHPSYWLIDGEPYFSVYEISRFMQGFAAVAQARAALDRFRAKARKAGFPGIHLNAVLWGTPNLPGSSNTDDWNAACRELGISSLTGYTWVHHGALDWATHPTTDYAVGRERYLAFAERAMRDYPVPYFPNTTIHWDNSPRAHPDADWSKPAAHVVNPVIVNNPPSAFKAATRDLAERLEAVNRGPKVITVNAWNEWPEGSTLEPEIEHGYGYLEAIRELFGPVAKDDPRFARAGRASRG